MTAVDVFISPGSDEDEERTLAAFGLVRREQDRACVTPWREAVVRPEASHVLLLRAGDKVESGALEALSCFAQAFEAQVTTMNARTPFGVIHSPRWLPLLLEQLPYGGRAVLIEGGYAAKKLPQLEDSMSDWEILLRVTSEAERIVHCPVTAVVQATTTSMAAQSDRPKLTRMFRAAQGRSAESVVLSSAGMPLVRHRDDASEHVSIIVPTAFASRRVDEATEVLVERLLRALVRTVEHDRWEVVLVVDETTADSAVTPCREIVGNRLRVVRTSGPFNFSVAVNEGARQAAGDVLLLLNDDVEPITSGWMNNLLGTLARPEVVVVGARLLFEDDTIQHMGVVCPPGELPMHPRIFEVDDPGHPQAQADVPYLAVTGACLMCTAADFRAVGGFNEDLPLNFNDIDFCLKAGTDGRAVICVNSVRMRHRESSTRRPQITSEEIASLLPWQHSMMRDPHIEYRHW